MPSFAAHQLILGIRATGGVIAALLGVGLPAGGRRNGVEG